MEYEYRRGRETPHVYFFDKGWEIRAIRSAFSEVITNRMLKANVSSISDWQAHLATVSRNQTLLIRALREPQQITDVLDDFHQNTEDAMFAITHELNMAAFQKGNIISKRKLDGADAGKLSVKMLEASAKHEMSADKELWNLPEDEQVERFLREIPEFKPPLEEDK